MIYTEILLSGITLGSVYAMLAVGLSLVYNVTGIFNWAYGSLFTWSGLFAWAFMVKYAELPYFIVTPLLIVAAFGFGYLIETLIIRPLRRQKDWQTTTMLVTLGLALLMDNLALLTFGHQRKTLPLMLTDTITVGGIRISHHDILIFVIGISAVLLLDAFLRHTRIGMSMRAISQDQVGSQMVGVNIDKVFAIAFGLSVALASIAAILITSKASISTGAGWQIFIKAFVVVSFAGMGNIRGVLYGAFILGIIEALVTWQFGSLWVYVYWLGTFLLLTAVRPQGLLPQKSIGRTV